MFKVYIDPGHGGNDSGAVGVRNVLEKNIVLEVGKKVTDILRNRGIEVKMSRTDDTFRSLSYRTNDANNWGADAFVSIHCNSSDNPKANGLEIFCYKFKYRQLADCILEEIKKEGLYNQLREGGVKEDNLHVVRETNMPACLVELGFITNEKDYNLIMNNKDRLAKAIARGICKFNGVTWKESSGSSTAVVFKNGDYSGRKARVTADTLNVRYDRGTQYNVIGQVKNGDIVNLQYCLNG